MRASRIKLIIVSVVMALLTVVCSSGYITPDSLTATAAAPDNQTGVPTAFFVVASQTPLPPPTETPIPEATATSPLAEAITPSPLPSLTSTDAPLAANNPPQIYYAQAGDSLDALAARFAVHPFEIVSPDTIPESAFINPGQMLMIPQRLGVFSAETPILPDSEFVYSPSAVEFNVITYVNTLGGYLSGYTEYLGSTGITSGAEIIQRVATENSINPRLLLSLLQYQSNWVIGQPLSLSATDYPMGHIEHKSRGLYRQLTWAVNQLSIGYYDWRTGDLTELKYDNGTTLRLAPTLNAASVGIMYFFHQVYQDGRWEQAVDPNGGLAAQHAAIFGDPWARAALVEPLLPPNLQQPAMVLPFMRGQHWAYTGGPHGAWELAGAQAAIDFAPGSVEHGCADSELWALASAPGVIARLGNGVVVIDLDGDGNEQTGWALLYLHLSDTGGLTLGQWVEKGDLLGHPSCEGGRSTGTHLHFARKYNGEWMVAAGPIPFTLGGWVVSAGDGPYQGFLQRGEELIKSCTCGSFSTRITRTHDDP